MQPLHAAGLESISGIIFARNVLSGGGCLTRGSAAQVVARAVEHMYQ